MKERISYRKMPPLLGRGLTPKEGFKKKTTSFSEIIKGEESPPKKGAVADNKGLPLFPQRRVSPKSITSTQAQRLAQYAPIIKEAASKYNVPVELICGVILQESGGNYKARSHAGARGLMQLMPATARRLGVKNSYNPIQNIDGGTKYLRFLLDRFNGNVELALAGYNAGEGNVAKYGNKIPPFKETQNYVPNVLGFCLSMIDILRQAPQIQIASATEGKKIT